MENKFRSRSSYFPVSYHDTIPYKEMKLIIQFRKEIDTQRITSPETCVCSRKIHKTKQKIKLVTISWNNIN